MKLWNAWSQAISLLRPAFSHEMTFLWFAVAVMGISDRRDRLGVTSIVRSLALNAKSYHCLLDHLRSEGINLETLVQRWTSCVFTLFGSKIERVNGRCVTLADGKKMAKTPEESKFTPVRRRLHHRKTGLMKFSFDKADVGSNVLTGIQKIPIRFKDYLELLEGCGPRRSVDP